MSKTNSKQKGINREILVDKMAELSESQSNASGELSDAQLDAVAGGMNDWRGLSWWRR